MSNYKTPEDELIDLYLTNVDDFDQFVTGEMYAWGNNQYSSLGRGNTVESLSPIQIGITNDWIEISSGVVNVGAIKGDSTLWTWGSGTNGTIGNGSTTTQSLPTLISSDWKSISCNDSMVGIKLDGTIWTWGYGSYGCLGNGSTTNISVPTQTLSGVWKQASAGRVHVSAIKTDGTLWSWGLNSYGGLGTLDTIHRSSPIQTVSTGTDWKYVSSGYYHTAAIKNDGSLWLWGLNNLGQLGNNTQTSTSSPVQTVSGGNNWKKVVASLQYTYALKNDGSLWAWGQGAYGFGDGTTTDKSSPVLIGTGYKDICESLYSAKGAIKNDGSLWVWGSNADITFRGIGDGSLNKSSPVQAVQVGSTWKKASLGIYQSAALVVKD